MFLVKIENPKFVRGIIGTNDILKSKRPQIAFIGRSNVGKSTLINNLTGKKDLVKTSGQPGKTKEINFFSAILTKTKQNKKGQPQKNGLGSKIYLVDLPGYGYAKISAKQREKMRKLILWYFISGEANIKKVVLIIDAKVGLKEFDLEMIDILKEYGHKFGYTFIVVANKADKLNQKEAHRTTLNIKEKIGTKIPLLLISARTGKNRNKLLEWIGK